jgi:methylmalonyl-CoA/ethylmalonyl-CoA epimerase
MLGAKVTEPQALPEHGVTVVFIELDNTKIELLEPLGENSPIAAFLAKNPSGGMHHVCYEVEDILAARDRAQKAKARGCSATASRRSAPTTSRCCFFTRRISTAP